MTEDNEKLDESDTDSIEKVLQHISKKWILYIVISMFKGKTKFNEFNKDNPRFSNKELSEKLKYMEEDGLIVKKTDPNNFKNTEYKLTDLGLKLDKVICVLILYSIEFDKEGYHNNERKSMLKKHCKNRLREILFKNQDVVQRRVARF